MKLFKLIAARLNGLFRPNSVDQDIQEELNAHIEMEVERNIERGMAPAEARRAAGRSFGNVGRIRSLARDVRGGGLLETLSQDIRYGLRGLRRNPGFTLVAVLTLALGIGANAAVFTVVNAVVLRQLPYPEPERIMRVGTSFSGDNELESVSEPKFLYWRQQNHSFDSLAIYQEMGSGVNLSAGAEPNYVTGLRVSLDYWRVLGVQPIVGRSFTKDEDSPGGQNVTVISDRLARRFGPVNDVIGKVVSLNSVSYTIIGVMPAGFQFSPSAEVFIPLRPVVTGDQDDNYDAIGRLKPWVTLIQARQDMRQVAEAFHYGQQTCTVQPLQENLTSNVRSLLFIMLGAVGFVLLIACANVANLQLTRAAGRQKEMALRSALGATWTRLTRQLLTEGVVLSLIGGSFGLLLAIIGVNYLKVLIPDDWLPQVNAITPDGHVLIFALSASILTGLLFGLAPAFQARRVDVNEALKDGSGKGQAGAGKGRLRGILVVSEIAISLVLLAGAALMIRTFINLRGVEPGFDAANVLTYRILPEGPSYDTAPKAAAFYRNALARIAALPGVTAAGVSDSLPLSRGFRVPLNLRIKPTDYPTVQYQMISPDYFNALKIGLRQGRFFTDADDENSEGVVIVNQAFVRKFLQNTEPLGQVLTTGRGTAASRPFTIVGVVVDIRQLGLDVPPRPTIFVPMAQVPTRLMLYFRKFRATRFIVRTTGGPLALGKTVKQEMLSLDPTLPVTEVQSMEQAVALTVAPQRFQMTLLGLFAGLGLMLAAIGIYGVVSYSVAQRTSEIGIRIALGAQTVDVLRLVLSHGMGLALIGIGLGVGGAIGLSRLMKAMLFGVSATDPLSFTAVALLLLMVTLLASYLPASRAAKVDPMIALRSN